jgi:hypothetical protein
MFKIYMTVRTTVRAIAFGMLLLGASVDGALAKPKEPEKVVLEKTLSGRTNPKAQMGNKVSKALQKATKLAEDEKYAEAVAAIDAALGDAKLTPYEVSKSNQMKASYLYQQDNYKGAYQAAKLAVDGNGLDNLEHLQTMFMMVQLLAQDDQFKESITAFNAYEKEAPKLKGNELYTQASAYYNLEDYKNALKYIDLALASGDEPQKQWYQVKANSYYQGEDYEGTVKYTKELMANTALAAKDPAGNKQWMSLLVSAYLSLEKFPEAQAVLADAKAKGQLDSDGLWTQLYQLYANTDKYVKAAETIDEGIKAGFLKSSAKLMTSQGQYYYTAAQDMDGKPEAKGLLEKAQTSLKAAIPLDVKDGTPELWLGQLTFFELDNPKAAREFLASAVKKTLKSPGGAYYLLGVTEDQSGNKAAARTALNEALKYPDSKVNAQKYLKNLK